MASRIASDHLVEHWQQVGQTLTGSGAGTDDVRLAPQGDFERVCLVLVEAEVGTEEAGRFGRDKAARLQVAQGGTRLKCRVELKHRIGPQLATGQSVADEPVDVRIENVDERLDILSVLVNNPIAECEDVH